jgi:hypothetical protein
MQATGNSHDSPKPSEKPAQDRGHDSPEDTAADGQTVRQKFSPIRNDQEMDQSQEEEIDPSPDGPGVRNRAGLAEDERAQSQDDEGRPDRPSGPSRQNTLRY